MEISNASLLRLLGEDDHRGDDHYDDHHHDEPKDSDNAWGPAMLGAFLVFLATFTGLVLLASYRGFAVGRNNARPLPKRLTKLIIPSFASGALLATSILLLIPESIELLSADAGTTIGEGHRQLEDGEHLDEDHGEHHEDDHSFAWKVGTAFIAGFVLPLILHAFFPYPAGMMDHEEHLELDKPGSSDVALSLSRSLAFDKMEVTKDQDSEKHNDEAADGETTFPGECETGDCCHKKQIDTTEDDGAVGDDDSQPCSVCPQEKRNIHNWSLVASIMVSDFLCNFADGVFIGSGFLLCSKSVAYGIVASTVYHELAQEIADFMLLTHTCGFTTTAALALNAVQGMAVFVGVVLILATDPTKAVIGALLAFSAGVFVHITAAECIPKIQSQLHNSVRNTATFLLCFMLGAVPIGLVLLDHGHCEAGEDDHGGHRI